MSGVFVFLIIVVSAVLVSCSDSRNVGSLRLVNVVFRHGQRTPADTYPKDPHLKFDFHPYGWGQLTNEGKREQYQLGRYLRERYNEFLGDRFATDKVRVQSTDVDRTIMSAQLVMAGLFPPVEDQRWNDQLAWQPVPVHSQPLQEDSLLLVRVPCPRYHEARDEVISSQHQDDLNLLYKALTEHSGMTISDPDDVQSLYSTMVAETQFNLTLPSWTKDYFSDKMAAVTAHSFTLNAFSDEMKKLKGGPLLKKILKDCEDKFNDLLSRQKMYVYAGHDSTVANLLSALKVWEEQIPVYNIMAIVELHEVDSVYGVKIFLRNSTEHNPYQLTVPGCTVFCPLNRLIEICHNVLPVDLETECVSRNPTYTPPTPSGP